MAQQAVIIGGGIIGLTTAHTLQEQGWQVILLAKALSPNTTSDKAGAIWFPYNVMPKDKALEWSRVSYNRWADLASTPDSGVDLVEFRVFDRHYSPTPPWWAAALPPTAYSQSREALPDGWGMAHELRVPFIDPSYALPYLTALIKEQGGHLTLRTIERLPDLCREYPNAIIVNCTGLGAKALAGDHTLYPIQGQAIVARRPALAIYRKADEGPTLPTYAFSRRNELLLGGTAIRHAYSETPIPETAADIGARCKRLLPELPELEVIRHTVGLRPFRPSIRLEVDEALPVVHNYGHGGGGYTACWGCAKVAAALCSQLARIQRG